jgi:hypothetical protein
MSSVSSALVFAFNIHYRGRIYGSIVSMASVICGNCCSRFSRFGGADVKARDQYGYTALNFANRAPVSRVTTLVQMTELHMTETVSLLLKEIQGEKIVGREREFL